MPVQQVGKGSTAEARQSARTGFVLKHDFRKVDKHGTRSNAAATQHEGFLESRRSRSLV